MLKPVFAGSQNVKSFIENFKNILLKINVKLLRKFINFIIFLCKITQNVKIYGQKI